MKIKTQVQAGGTHYAFVKFEADGNVVAGGG